MPTPRRVMRSLVDMHAARAHASSASARKLNGLFMTSVPPGVGPRRRVGVSVEVDSLEREDLVELHGERAHDGLAVEGALDAQDDSRALEHDGAPAGAPLEA